MGAELVTLFPRGLFSLLRCECTLYSVVKPKNIGMTIELSHLFEVCSFRLLFPLGDHRAESVQLLWC